MLIVCKLARFGSHNGEYVWRHITLTSAHFPRRFASGGFVPLSSIPREELGQSILHLKENGALEKTTTDVLRKSVVFAKFCSLGSTALGAIMAPLLTSQLWESAAEKPSAMLFLVGANTLLVLLTFTPLLLHFLAKRFVVNAYYDPKSQFFTTVHYNFFLRRRALRFRAEEVVDAAVAPESKRLWIPLATCFVYGQPLLLSLDRRQYRDDAAFLELTRNVDISESRD